jgi:hypothetical protein
MSTCGKLITRMPVRGARGSGNDVGDLRQLFNDLVRFEIAIWNAADARLRADFDLPLSQFEPMSRDGHFRAMKPYSSRLFKSPIRAWIGTVRGCSRAVTRAGPCRWDTHARRGDEQQVPGVPDMFTAVLAISLSSGRGRMMFASLV